MEYAKGGELFKLIVNKKRLDESEASLLLAQLICGLEIIHKNGIVHRDIKPENLLLKENNILSIIDFGLSNSYKKGQFLSTSCGSQCYQAPEMLSGEKYSPLPVDIWSSGIVLYAMVCGYLPFEDRDPKVLYDKIIEAKFDIPRYIGNDCRDLLLKILETDPRKRISLENIKQHPFLKQAFNLYKVEEHIAEKNSVCEPVIEFMTHSNIKSIGEWKREEILSNLKYKCHNEITTTYYLLFNKFKFNNNLFHQYTNSNTTKATTITTNSLLSSSFAVIPDNNTNKNNNNSNNNTLISTPINNNYAKDYSDIKSLNDYRINYNLDDGKSVNSNLTAKKPIRPGSSTKKPKNFSSKKSSHSSRGIPATTAKKSSSKAKTNSKGIYKPNDVVISLNVTKLLSKNTKDDFIDIGTPKVLAPMKRLCSSSAKSKNSSKSKKSYDKNKKINPFFNRKTEVANKKVKLNYVPSNTINLDEDLPETPTKAKLSKPSSHKSLISFSEKKLLSYLSYTFKSNSEFKLDQTLTRYHSDNIHSEIKLRLEYFKDSESENSYQANNFDALSTCTIPRTYKKSHFVIPMDKNNKNIDGQSIGSSPSRTNRNVPKKNESNYNSNDENFQLYQTMIYDNLNKNNSKKIELAPAVKKTKVKPKTSGINFTRKKSPQAKGKNGSKLIPTPKNANSQARTNLKNNLNNNSNNKPKNKAAANNNVINLCENDNNPGNSTSNDYCPSFTEHSEENSNKVLHSHKSNTSNKSNNTTLGFSVKNKQNKKNDGPVTVKAQDSITNKQTKNSNGNGTKKPQTKRTVTKRTGTTVIGIDITEQSDTASVNSDYSIGSQRSVRLRKPIGIGNINSSKNKNKGQKQTTQKVTKKGHGNNIVDVIDLSDEKVEEKKEKPKPKPVLLPTAPEVQFDLVEDLETKAKIINNAKDLAVCPVSGTLETIINKLNNFCKENSLTLINLGTRFICKKDSDNSISIEISGSGENNVLKLYHLNGQETITKEIIKKIIMTLGFE